jgi:hypothetical protein
MPPTLQYNIHTEMTKLRISLLRVAQAANVPLPHGLPQDASYTTMVMVAEREQRGWNALCASIIDAISYDGKTIQCHYCGSTEPPVDEQGHGWPFCPHCKGI